ncbi:MAG: hypothetical protein AAGF12_12600 [Myxococcota bacterium]
MTAPRMSSPGRMVALTRRTTFRKGFLGPWDPWVMWAWLYCLARGQQAFAVDVHMTTLVPSHMHTTVTPHTKELSRFTEKVHGEFSCALNQLLLKRGYDKPRQVWDGRECHWTLLVDPPAQLSRLVYDYTNNASAGLVERPEQMPGAQVSFRDWKGGPRMIPRFPLYFDPAQHEPELPLSITPPAMLYRDFGGQVDKLVYHMEKTTETALSAIAAERRGRPVLGPSAVTKLDPWSEPSTMAESGGERIPTFQVGAKGLLGKSMHIQCCEEVTAFRKDHRVALGTWRDGDREVEFPYGTYQMAEVYGANCKSAPPAGAILLTPGPTLDDVKAELAARTEAFTMDAALAVVDEAKAALSEESEAIVRYAEQCVPLPGTGRHVSVPAAGAHPPSSDASQTATPTSAPTEERPDELEVRGLSAPRRLTGRHPRRTVTLRRRRRRSNKGGSEPPSQ